MTDKTFWEITIIIIGGLSSVLGFAKLLMEIVIKPILNYKSKLKSQEEADSHRTILDAIEELKEGQLDLKGDLEILKKNQKSDRKLNKVIAELSLSIADETGEKGYTNGRTAETKQKARRILLEDYNEE